MKKIFLFVLLIAFSSTFFGQITTAVNPTIAQMQALLQGSGVVVTGLNITCPPGAYATFNNGAAALGAGLNTGILLTTGTAASVAGPPSGFASQDNSSAGGGGSALGNTLSGGTTYDGCYINFMITPSCATLSINYVFASEEYPEFATGSINDVFGFVISGPNPLGGNYNQYNTALLPVTTTTSNVVSIQNVNNGSANAGPCTNCAYYIDSPPGLIYDGKTPVMTASCAVTPCQTYTMTIGVWDDSDGVYDSGVFLDVNGLSCANQPTITATVSPTTICGPQTVTLTATGGFAIGSYTWSAPASGGLTSTTGSVVTANPTAATTYTVKYSDINTCPGLPVTQTVSIAFTPPPALPVSQSPTGAICAGQSVTLTANGGAGTYSWSPGTGLSTTSSSVTVSTPAATTTYTVTKTVGACVSSTVITVTVGGSSVAITPSLSTICAGQSQPLSASGAGPFAWTASSGPNPPAAGNVTVTPGTTTTYTVLSGTGACTAQAVATVSISVTPAIAITPSLSTICAGQSQPLSSSGAGPFVWTASSGPNPPAAANVTVTPSTTTTYTVLSGTGTCTASAVATVSISLTPSITITPSLSTICTGQSQPLSASGAGPFVWTASTGTNPPAAGNVTVTPGTTTTYTVLSGTGACTAQAVATVSVGASPAINITPSNTTICLGESVGLSSSGAGPFTWTASTGSSPTSAANVTVTPSSSTTYTVLSGTGACTAQAVATVSIAPTLSINITPSSTVICLGESVGLSSTGAGPFTWTASTGTAPASAANVTVTPASNTTYTVLSGTGACTAQAVATVSVSPALSINITPASTIICSGQSTILSTSGTASAGPFAWGSSTGTTPLPTSTVSVSPSTTTTYTVLAGTGACTAQAVATVSVSPTLTVTITPSNTNICTGSGTTLTAGGATNYVWSTGSAAPSIAVTPTTTTVYTLVGTNGICTNSATAIVNVISVTTTVSASSPYYCLGVSPVSLTGNGATTYTWTGSALSSTTGSLVAATPSTTSVYTVTGETSGCTSTQTISLTVPPVSTITASANNTVICVGGTGSTLTANGASTYTWSPGFATTQTLSVNPATTTSYTVAGQTAQGCFEVPAVVTVSVLPSVNPVLVASSPTVCLTKSVTISSPPLPGLTYTWQPTNAISGANNTSSIVAVPPTSATVIYTVIVSNGVCSGSDTIQLKIFTAPNLNNFTTLNNDTVCVGGCVTFSANSTGSMPITYQWYYESGVGTSSVGIAPEACYPSAGTFSVMSIATNVCGNDTMVKTGFVTVYDMPILIVHGDTTINIGETAEVFASGGLSYSWSSQPVDPNMACPTCSNTVVQPTVTTQYIVVASNSPYCKVQDTVTVVVDINCGDFFVPNVFSPNDDGLNDVINVHGRCISTYNLQIFSRWGEKVFETTTQESSWDGSFRGKKMDTGVFVYKADGVSIDGQTFSFKGNITLIR
ncbi:MAG: choice-of-anchor L domain-containing protein [Bacteroidota bacterium]